MITYNDEIQSAHMALGYKINGKKIKDLKDLIRADARISRDTRNTVCALLAAAHKELDNKVTLIGIDDDTEINDDE